MGIIVISVCQTYGYYRHFSVPIVWVLLTSWSANRMGIIVISICKSYGYYRHLGLPMCKAYGFYRHLSPPILRLWVELEKTLWKWEYYEKIWKTVERSYTDIEQRRGGKEREGDRQTVRQRQRDTETERQIQRHRDRDTHRDRQRDKRGRQAGRPADRQTDWRKDRPTVWQTQRNWQILTKGQTDITIPLNECMNERRCIHSA